MDGDVPLELGYRHRLFCPNILYAHRIMQIKKPLRSASIPCMDGVKDNLVWEMRTRKLQTVLWYLHESRQMAWVLIFSSFIFSPPMTIQYLHPRHPRLASLNEEDQISNWKPFVQTSTNTPNWDTALNADPACSRPCIHAILRDTLESCIWTVLGV